MVQELGCSFRLLGGPVGAHRCFPAFSNQRFVATEELFHLQGVISERLGGGVDGREPAADHNDREPHLQIREALGLGGASKLQCHEEIGCLAYPCGKAVLHRHDGRPPCPRAERNVVEAERKSALDCERAAEAHAAEHREFIAPFQQQTHELEEILVPAHGDAVFGNPAESGHHASIELFAQRGGVPDRAERGARAALPDPGNIGLERFDLEPVDRHDSVTVIDQVMGQREACGAQSDDEHLVAGRRLRQRPTQIEWVPARQ